MQAMVRIEWVTGEVHIQAEQIVANESNYISNDFIPFVSFRFYHFARCWWQLATSPPSSISANRCMQIWRNSGGVFMQLNANGKCISWLFHSANFVGMAVTTDDSRCCQQTCPSWLSVSTELKSYEKKKFFWPWTWDIERERSTCHLRELQAIYERRLHSGYIVQSWVDFIHIAMMWRLNYTWYDRLHNHDHPHSSKIVLYAKHQMFIVIIPISSSLLLLYALSRPFSVQMTNAGIFIIEFMS